MSFLEFSQRMKFSFDTKEWSNEGLDCRGTGFIGSRLALCCLQRGESVTLLGQVNNPAKSENRRVLEERGAKIILVSVADRERVLDALEGIECVYHLVAAQNAAKVSD